MVNEMPNIRQTA